MKSSQSHWKSWEDKAGQLAWNGKRDEKRLTWSGISEWSPGNTVETPHAELSPDTSTVKGSP